MEGNQAASDCQGTRRLDRVLAEGRELGEGVSRARDEVLILVVVALQVSLGDLNVADRDSNGLVAQDLLQGGKIDSRARHAGRVGMSELMQRDARAANIMGGA